MAGINKVILVGRLGKDPETKFTPNGVAVTSFTIATSEEWKNKDTGEKNSKTEWHRIVTWNRLAEICGEYLSKGSQIYIEGRLQTREWEDRDGNKKYTTEIIAQSMQMLDSPKKEGNTASGGNNFPAEEPPSIPEDSIPF